MMNAEELLMGGGVASVSAGAKVNGTAKAANGASPTAAKGHRAAGSTVLLVWFALFALLVLSHVLTLSVQR
jgi:hypothetical protein